MVSNSGDREEARPSLSVIVPCLNESEVIRETNRRLISTLEGADLSFEIIYVDDGSTDETANILKELQQADARLRVVRFSRNFGHQFAITGGLEHVSGDAVVLIDADLQDPPDVILEMVNRWVEGWDVVYGTRVDREGESPFKLKTAKIFYRLINKMADTPMPLDTGDFRLMDRRVVDVLLAMPERDRFLRGMVSWVGFRQTAVEYHRAPRFAGATKYPLKKMVRFAMDGILSFSVVPLHIATLLGIATSVLSLIGCVLALVIRLWGRHWVTGWASLFLAILFIGGIQLVCLGIFGEYLGRVYGEVKHRPLYVVQERFGFQVPEPRALARARRKGAGGNGGAE